MDENTQQPEQPQEEVKQEEAKPVEEAPVEQPQPETPKVSAEQDFMDKYDALVDTTGLVFKIEPKFIQKEDGTYSTTHFSIQVVVGKK